MTKRLQKTLLAGAATLAVLALQVPLSTPADAAAKCMTGEREAPFTIGWANI